MYNPKVIPGISVDGHHAIYVECDITPIRNKQVPMEIKLYSKADWEGFKDRMSTVKDSFMAMHFVHTPIDSMWNDPITDLERALDEFIPQKIARTKKKSAMGNQQSKEAAKKTKETVLKAKGIK